MVEGERRTPQEKRHGKITRTNPYWLPGGPLLLLLWIPVDIAFVRRTEVRLGVQLSNSLRGRLELARRAARRMHSLPGGSAEEKGKKDMERAQENKWGVVIDGNNWSTFKWHHDAQA